MTRADLDYLLESLEHLEILQGYAAHHRFEEQIVLDAISLRLSAAIDAVAKVSADRRVVLFGTSWAGIWATRNRIVHAYLRIDRDLIAATVEHDVPTFEATLRHAVSEMRE